MNKPQENNELQKNEENSNNNFNEFNFILNRSESVDKLKHINNKVKEIDYTYSSEDNYSDEILYYLTQRIDKINQYKYNYSLNNSNSNFKIYNVIYTNDIDAFYQYELIKKEVHNHKKAFNVHEHRKISFGEENRQMHRRKFHNNNSNTNNFHIKKYNERRNSSVGMNHRFFEEKRNRNKVKIGGILEFDNNNKIDDSNDLDMNNNESGSDINKSMDNIISSGIFGIKRQNHFFNKGLSSYQPFNKVETKNYKEDND